MNAVPRCSSTSRVIGQAARRPRRDLADGRNRKRSTPSFLPEIKQRSPSHRDGIFFFVLIGNKRSIKDEDYVVPQPDNHFIHVSLYTSFGFGIATETGGVRRGCLSRRSAGKPTAAAAAMFVPTSAFRRFSESPKHPIDCPTSFAGTRELVHRSPPVPPRSLYPAPLLLSFLPPSTFSLAALGMANTPPCRGYVSRMRPPLPPAAIHPSPFPRLCHARRRASQYGRQLVQPSPLFLP